MHRQVSLRLLGGAARAKKEAAEAAHRAAMEAEYQSWHGISDQTENTGVMRVVSAQPTLHCPA